MIPKKSQLSKSKKKPSSESPCVGCPFKGRIKVPYDGDPQAEVALHGMEPGIVEIEQGLPFVGPSGKLLFDTVGRHELTRENCRILNARRCRAEPEDTPEMMDEATKRCRVYVVRALAHRPLKLIVALGDVAFRQIMKSRKRKITQAQGYLVWSKEFDCWVLPNTHPAHALRQRSAEVTAEFQHAFDKIPTALSNTEIRYGNYRRVDDLTDFMSDALASDWTAYDEENYSDGRATSPLNWWHKSVRTRCVGLSCKDRESVVVFPDESPKVKRQLKDMLERRGRFKKLRLVGQNNILYDDPVAARAMGIHIEGQRYDLLPAAHLLDENRSNGLSNLAYVYTDMGGYDSRMEALYDKERMDEIPVNDLIPYNGGDADCCRRSWLKVMAELKLPDNQRLAVLYDRLALPAAWAIRKMSDVGTVIDAKIAAEVRDELLKIQSRSEYDCLLTMPTKVRIRHAGKLSISRDAMVRDALFTKLGFGLIPAIRTEKTKLASVSADALAMLDSPYQGHKKLPASFAAARAWADLKIRWDECDKAVSTYVDGFTNLMQDGRVWPTYTMAHTVTGRTSAQRPPFQQIPKHKEYTPLLRRMFTAPSGHVIVIADFSRIELLVAAWMAGEQTMLDAFRKGVDLHTLTASAVMRVPLARVTEEQRFKAKAVGFGFVYGAQAQTFKDYAKSDYGMDLTLREAEDFRARFFNLYSGLLSWHERTRKFCRRNGYVESLIGRRRRLPDIDAQEDWKRFRAERQSLNAPVQAFGSGDLGMLVLIDLVELSDKGILPFGFIHDATAFYVRKGAGLEKRLKLIKDIMEHPRLKEKFGIEFPVGPFVDLEVGKSLADLKKWEASK